MSTERRAEIEAQIGYKTVKVARVGKSLSSVPPPLPGAPSHWKRSIKALTSTWSTPKTRRPEPSR